MAPRAGRGAARPASPIRRGGCHVCAEHSVVIFTELQCRTRRLRGSQAGLPVTRVVCLLTRSFTPRDVTERTTYRPIGLHAGPHGSGLLRLLLPPARSRETLFSSDSPRYIEQHADSEFLLSPPVRRAVALGLPPSLRQQHLQLPLSCGNQGSSLRALIGRELKLFRDSSF
jgi:hypothetical protein